MFISDIAEQQPIPKKFLEQILLDLKRHGILISRRGKFDGYQLLKDPSEITFGSNLRIVDGPIAPLPCLSKMACPFLVTAGRHKMPARSPWRSISASHWSSG